jgi:hypothetical protein
MDALKKTNDKDKAEVKVQKALEDIKIRLSTKDKNLISLFWLLEINLSAIVKMADSDIPARKKEMYSDIIDQIKPLHEVVQKLNDMYEDEINKVFSVKFSGHLADACIAVVTLLETLDPKQISSVMEQAGISKQMQYKNWVNGGRGK